MNVLIFAAGLGTRLKPLTDTMPKALVPVDGTPLLKHLIDKLKKSLELDSEHNSLNIVVNVYHFAEKIIDYVKDNDSFGVNICFSDERELLLETGGGLKKALPLFPNEAPVLVHNVDILSNLNLKTFYQSQKAYFETDCLVGASLLVSERDTNRYLLFDDDSRLVGWTNIQTGEVKSPYPNLNVDKCNKYAFSGIQIVNPKVLKPLFEKWEGKFSIIDFYLSVCDKIEIHGAFRSDIKLLDVGKLDSLEAAKNFCEE